MASADLSPLERARRRGRRAGIVVFALIVSTFTAVSAVQIILQIWSPEVVETDVGCREGLKGLVDALRRARSAAAAETGGERAALKRFRHQLEPEWTARPALTEICRNDPQAAQALPVVDRLRYAEEHAVRYGAADLNRLRRQVIALENELFPQSGPTAVAR